MNIELLCYASGWHWESRHYLVDSARRYGRFDKIHACTRSSLPDDYILRHHDILGARKGDGYWLWKPYLLMRRLDSMPDGDLLFYADAGCRFISDPAPLCKLASDEPSGVLVFRLDIPERHYTKRTAFRTLGLDSPEFTDSPQILASYFILRAGSKSRALVREWLSRCERPELITDSPSPVPPGEYPDFKAHRHDQSLLSLTCKQMGILAKPDPSQFGNHFPDRTLYPQIFDHHRGIGLPLPRTPGAMAACVRSRVISRIQRLMR